MTAQASELLIHQGRELRLCETPLDDYLDSIGRHIKRGFKQRSVAGLCGHLGNHPWPAVSRRP